MGTIFARPGRKPSNSHKNKRREKSRAGCRDL
jgi:hypothetical protein